MMVSIIMTAYNGEQFIEESIKAVLCQTYNDIELLISDDCSIDRTREIMEFWSKKDNRVKVFYNENNVGIDKSRRNLINNSNGDYVVILDQDDLIVENHIEKMLTKMNDDVSLVFCDYVKIDKDGKIFSEKIHCKQKELFTKDLVKYNPVPVIGILINKKKLEQIGFWITIDEFPHYAEWLNWISLSEIGRLLLCDEVKSRYRRHESNLSNAFKTEKDNFSNFAHMCQKRALYSKKLPLKYKIKYSLLLSYRNLTGTNI